ncbi:Alcohol dehydrogenase 2 [Phytophthora cinnamomi]|uniref:Alcohol dehydrogenase 2 n=1 Tax=Phytophthora cinnamomi TaxID=4785 RepID=UPI003559CC25|nr:Alcohol dehydrogenase 2 [Phytophthora cinnamomi]
MHAASSLDGSDPPASASASDEAELKFVAERADDAGPDAFPQNEECVAILTMKCGEPLMAVRKKLHDEIPIPFIPDEGFGVFQSKVERHYTKLGPNYVQERRAIYLKPSSNATQSKYVQLTKENFDPLLRVRWKVARSMKVELKYEVFCYFVDITTKKEKKRLSMKMFQQQQQQQQQQLADGVEAIVANGASAATASPNPSFLAFGQPGSAGFPLIQSYADMSIDGSLTPGSSATKTTVVRTGVSHKNGVRDEAIQSSDRPRKVARGKQAAATAAAAEQLQLDGTAEDAVFHTIPFRINGFVVPLEVDIMALKRSLGLIQPSSDAPGSLDPTSHL